MYQVQITKTGDVLGDFNTLEEAEEYADSMCSIDRRDANHMWGYYSIYDTESGECERHEE